MDVLVRASLGGHTRTGRAFARSSGCLVASAAEDVPHRTIVWEERAGEPVHDRRQAGVATAGTDPFARARPRRRRAGGAITAAVAAGGAIGGGLRHLCGRLGAHTGIDPVVTVGTINVLGSVLIGALMAVIAVRTVPRLARPFLATGVLGGFTTFSTAALDLHDLVADGRILTAAVLVMLTPVGALAGVWTGHAAMRRLVTRRTS